MFGLNLKRLLSWILAAGICLPAGAQEKAAIIPDPATKEWLPGSFKLNTLTKVVSLQPETHRIADQLRVDIQERTGYQLPVQKLRAATAAGGIGLLLNKNPDPSLGTEGYMLYIQPEGIRIKANTAHGVFNGVQSLLQLIDSKGRPKPGTAMPLRCLKIQDQPRFGWRGLMLDVSRHFFSKAFVKKYINEMARYKLNVFHWHLTDDNGWRIEIKGLPKLTEVGAWRVPRTGTWAALAPQSGEAATYGGYYTQEEIREIVRYAADRFITIIPEIDVPGHCQALIAAYPGLSCSQQQYPVSNGAGSGQEHNVLCPANDSVYLVLDKIFTQVAELFPGDYIHTGGDEVSYRFWEKHPACQTLMKREKITTGEAYQAYFGQKVAAIVRTKGKKMACWYGHYFDERDKETTMYSWTTREDGIRMSQKKVPVVMTPAWDTYLDFFQGVFSSEPVNVIPGIVRLKHCYEFDPAPEGANVDYILGGQGNLWTESVPSERHAEYMTWPRALALAEVFWSPPEQRNWPGFTDRVINRLAYFQRKGINYAESFYNPVITGVKDSSGKYQVKLDSELPGVQLYYTFDGTNADAYCSRYNGMPLNVPREASQIRVMAYRAGKPLGHQIVFMLSELSHPNLR
ncbi:family 20 glycosylhydrolase [Niabella sp. CC-SYL272]|uniref:family 20 glycosylhydrolase n=1 Tax=Niabella agricola TaxID=2891571 RepID=UPI001F35CC57|nr:family 20 glycosylhydrolase [Niabella agricola]MCF3111302.1 family 20 glycosylhydrolase [Niabella agricola]